MIAEGQFANADDQLDVGDVTPDCPGDRDWREMISTRMTIRGKPDRAESARRRDQVTRRPGRVVGTKHANDGGHSAQGKLAQVERRDPGLRPRFTATTGKMDVPVDQPGNNPLSAEIALDQAENRGKAVEPLPHPQDLPATHENLAAPGLFRAKDVTVSKQLKHACREWGEGRANYIREWPKT